MLKRLEEIAKLLDGASLVANSSELTEARGLLQDLIDDLGEPENAGVVVINPYLS